MKLILLILAGLSAFMLGVIAGLIRNRRCSAKAAPQAAASAENEQFERLNQEYRNFLSYDGSEQV